jgi:hypothetical protein
MILIAVFQNTASSFTLSRAGLPYEAGSLAAIDATAGAGLVDADRTEFRQQWLEFGPDEFGQHFAGRVFQARNVVQIVVVQTLVQRLEDRLDLRKSRIQPVCGSMSPLR